MQTYKIFVSIILSFWAFSPSIASTLNQAGVVPLKPSGSFANDLSIDGIKTLSPFDLEGLSSSELAKIEPLASDVYPNTQNRKDPYALFASELADIENQKFQFVKNMTYIRPKFRFAIKNQNSNKGYQVILGVQSQSFLLRAALMRKLGYRTPPIKYVKNLDLSFKSKFEVSSFLNASILNTTGKSPSAWVKDTSFKTTDSGKKIYSVKEETKLKLHDVILIPSPEGTNPMIDLNLGLLVQKSNKRALNAAIIPWALISSPESINLMNWRVGEVNQGYLVLDSELTVEVRSNLNPSFHDGLWMTQKVLKLTEQDLAEITKQSQYPDCIEQLYLEKLKSRRNSLLGHYEQALHQSLGKKFTVNTKISCEKNGFVVENGHITKGQGTEVASDFADPDGSPDSPLSSKEVFSFITQKAKYGVLNELVKRFNKDHAPKTDLLTKIKNERLDAAVDELVKAVEEGRPAEAVPFGVYAIPNYSVNTILFRDLFLGSFQGSSNLVNVVDTIGLQANAGVYLGFHGLPAGLGASVTADAVITRTYSHVQPASSIVDGENKPFKNILVPLVEKEIGSRIVELTGAISKENRKESLKELIKTLIEFNNYLNVGESLIISDSLGPKVQASLGYSLAKRVSAQLAFQSELKFLNRLHIHRPNEDSIQIYDDKGTLVNFSLFAGITVHNLKAIGLSFSYTPSGKARTDFYEIPTQTSFADLTPESEDFDAKLDKLVADLDDEKTAELSQTYSVLGNLLLSGNTSYAEASYTPIKLEYDFSETTSSFDILFFKHKSVEQIKKLKMTLRNGQSGVFHRTVKAKRWGKDYQSFATDLINEALRRADSNLENVISLGLAPSDSGDSIYGSSKTSALEVQLREREDYVTTDGGYSDLFVQHRSTFKGWELSQGEYEETLKDLETWYGSSVASADMAAALKSLTFYRILVSTNILESGVDHFIQNIAKLDKQYKSYGSYLFNINEHHAYNSRVSTKTGENIKFDEISGDIHRAVLKYHKAHKKKNARKVIKALDQVLAGAFELFMLPGKGVMPKEALDMLFGPEGYVMQAQILGFRDGQEDAVSKPSFNTSIVGGTSDNISNSQGPWGFQSQKHKIHQGQFFINWILERY